MVTGWLLTVVVLVAGDRHHGNDHQHHHHGNVHLLCNQHHPHRHHGNDHQHHHHRHHGKVHRRRHQHHQHHHQRNVHQHHRHQYRRHHIIMVVIWSIGDMTKKAEKIREHYLSVHLCMSSVKTKKPCLIENDLFRLYWDHRQRYKRTTKLSSLCKCVYTQEHTWHVGFKSRLLLYLRWELFSLTEPSLGEEFVFMLSYLATKLCRAFNWFIAFL